MKMKRKLARGGPSKERWLLTYSDLITLLLIFFIMMYVISSVNAQKFQAIAVALGATFGNRSSGILNQPGNSIFPPQLPGKGQAADSQEAERMNQIKTELEQYLKEKNLQGKVTVQNQERGLVISFQDTILFPSGSAELTDNARTIVTDIGGKLRQVPNYLRVEGHTDNVPINTAVFPSNWELSAERATNVVKELIGSCGIAPGRLSATGYGEYRPKAANDSESNRQRNRRVDILILREIYQQVEPTR